MYIKLFDLINLKPIDKVIDKNLTVIPTLFIDSNYDNKKNNIKLEKIKYNIEKPEIDKDYIDDEIYDILFNNLEESNKNRDKNGYENRDKNVNKKLTKRCKKIVKSRMSRKHISK